MRIALATLRYRPNPEDTLAAVVAAIRESAGANARMLCTAECFLPGLRGVGHDVARPDATFQAHAERTIAEAAATWNVGAIVGVERLVAGTLIASALVVAPGGRMLGHQDKVQIDPTEEGTYVPGEGRRVFEVDGTRFGVVICHEGWRYPETVRWAARNGAHIVFHPQYAPATTAPRDPAWASATGTMHEKAAICRAAENTIWFATVNYAIENAIAGTALIDPDGNVTAAHQRGTEHVLIADIEEARATALLAHRLTPP